MTAAGSSKPRVVILGGGFGGLSAARALRRAPVDLTVVDAVNHHLFQPLLYQVAMATLAPSDISAPIRWLLRKQRNTRVLMATALEVDPDHKVVRLDREPHTLPFDYLIIATGSRHAYFGHDKWEPLAPGLKSLADALEIRQRFLGAFEKAESLPPEEQAPWQTFVIVGGGPTGVELAGLVPAIAGKALRDDFRQIDTSATRVILLEGGPRLLSAFPASLSERALQDLRELGVDVRLNALVTGVDATGVDVGDERIETRTVLWAAGNAASPLTRSLGVPLDRAGRVLAKPDLSIPGHPDIFVAGDLVAFEQNGKFVPGVAPAANQEGRLAAVNILRSIRGEPRKVFRYRNKGDLATIGRHRAVADFGRVRVTGWIAWWLWLFVHILYLAGFRNRISVLVQWAYAYFTYQRGVRLIVGETPASQSRPPDDEGRQPRERASERTEKASV